jgi:hypothetical protein
MSLPTLPRSVRHPSAGRCVTMVAEQTSETSVNSHRSTRRYNPENSHLLTKIFPAFYLTWIFTVVFTKVRSYPEPDECNKYVKISEKVAVVNHTVPIMSPFTREWKLRKSSARITHNPAQRFEMGTFKYKSTALPLRQTRSLQFNCPVT